MKSGREVDSASFVLGAVEDRAAPGCLHLQTDDGTNRDIRCTLMPPRKLQNRTTSHDVTVSTIGKRGGERNICALHDRNAPPGGVGPDELSVLTRFTSDCVSPGILTSSCSWNSDSSSSRTLASCILFFLANAVGLNRIQNCFTHTSWLNSEARREDKVQQRLIVTKTWTNPLHGSRSNCRGPSLAWKTSSQSTASCRLRKTWVSEASQPAFLY